MGDIIWGTFLILIILIAFLLYRFFTRKNVEQRSFVKFLLIVLTIGGLFGVLTTGLNERLLDEHPNTYFLVLLFFLVQTSASILYYRAVKVGLPLLTITLLFQIPIIREVDLPYGYHLSYRNQTLFSFNLEHYPGKFWDIEPGSYVHFVYYDFDYAIEVNSIRKSGFGLNLIPIATILFLLFSKRRAITTRNSFLP